MIVLTAEDVAALLPMDEAIKVIDRAMRVVSDGGAEFPLRSIVPLGGPNMMGVMPGVLSAPRCHGVKLISLYPGNPERGLSSHRGAYVLFESETGGAVAMMDAGLLTAIRTAAASAVATRVLARDDATVLAMVGYGEQAEHHLRAMLAVRPIRELRVTGRSEERARDFAQDAGALHPELKVSWSTNVSEAVDGADIICTVTASATPVLRGAWLSPGTHVNAVGASVASRRELDDAAVLAAAVIVDHRASALAQAGEIVEMIAAGTIGPDHIRAEIGRVLSGRATGRGAPEEITLYRSLGIAAQDLAAAHHVWTRARAEHIGQVVQL